MIYQIFITYLSNLFTSLLNIFLITFSSWNQSFLQTAEDEMAATLGMLNTHIGEVFGRPKSMFLDTTPRDLLFHGITLCANVRGVAQLLCNVLKERKLKTIQKLNDGSLIFALFRYVSIGKKYVFLIISFGTNLR